MATKPKNNVTYFPHKIKHGKRMHYIETKYKNDGYAVWHKLLEELGSADYHYLNISDDITLMFLSARFNVTEQLLRDIIIDLVKLKVFDKDLYEAGILFNQEFVDSVEDAYDKRTNPVINKTSLRILLSDSGILSPDFRVGNGPKGDGSPQSKVKESKVKESKGDIYRQFSHLKISNTEISKLLDLNFTMTEIDATLDAIQNYRKNKNYTSLYLTAKKWLEKDRSDAKKENSSEKKTADEVGKAVDKKILDKLNGL